MRGTKKEGRESRRRRGMCCCLRLWPRLFLGSRIDSFRTPWDRTRRDLLDQCEGKKFEQGFVEAPAWKREVSSGARVFVFRFRNSERASEDSRKNRRERRVEKELIVTPSSFLLHRARHSVRAPLLRVLLSLARENAPHSRCTRRPRPHRFDEHSSSDDDDDRCCRCHRRRRIDLLFSSVVALLRRGCQGDHGHRRPRGRPAGPRHAQVQARARAGRARRGRRACVGTLSAGAGRVVRGAVSGGLFFHSARELLEKETFCGRWSGKGAPKWKRQLEK